jgi:uncharacterized protein YecE (DUF72 family)
LDDYVENEARLVTQYLIGTGGWAYFNAPDKSSLEAYSKVFNFVEVNYTFYEYPEIRRVEQWRRIAPKDFTFTVRCHQDLTHRIGLRPVDEAYAVFGQMIGYCRILNAPFLHLETPASYSVNDAKLEEAKDFFSTIDSKGVRLAWEIRGSLTEKTVDLLRDFNIVHSVDLSRDEPALPSDAIYTRLFGKGKHNVYQFTDEELEEIDQRIVKAEAKTAVITYHGIRMNVDAIRFEEYKETGTFPQATQFTGVDSARAVLSEDAIFPSTKADLIEHQGWKVIDLTAQKRVHLSDLLSKLPEKTYDSLDAVVQELEVAT